MVNSVPRHMAAINVQRDNIKTQGMPDPNHSAVLTNQSMVVGLSPTVMQGIFLDVAQAVAPIVCW